MPSHAVALVLAGALCTTSIEHTPDNAFDPVGRWESGAGYTITLTPDESYRFCDRSWCTEGTYRRTSPRSVAIVLVDFFAKKNAVRISHTLKALRYYRFPGENLRDFNFSVNSGWGNAEASPFCDGKPCVLFGNLDTGPHLAFVKSDSR